MNDASLKISRIEPTPDGVLLRVTGERDDFTAFVTELKTRFHDGVRWTPTAFDGKGAWFLPYTQFTRYGRLFANLEDALVSAREYLDERIKEQQNHLTVEQAYELLHLRSTAPVSIIKAVYRVLAQEAHPDRGGSHEQMVLLNQAYELVQIHVGGKTNERVN